MTKQINRVWTLAYRWFNGLGSYISVSNRQVFPSNSGVKTPLAMVIMAVGAVMWCALSSDQRLPFATPWPPSQTAWPSQLPGEEASNPLIINELVAMPSPPAAQPQPKVPTFDQTPHRQEATRPGQLPAGVYRTLPYTCIVVVPGPCPDESAVLNPGSGNYRMPVVRPDLQFIPLSPTNK